MNVDDFVFLLWSWHGIQYDKLVFGKLTKAQQAKPKMKKTFILSTYSSSMGYVSL
jgi:hypothetical protein